jgi:hypothetical protein
MLTPHDYKEEMFQRPNHDKVWLSYIFINKKVKIEDPISLINIR